MRPMRGLWTIFGSASVRGGAGRAGIIGIGSTMRPGPGTDTCGASDTSGIGSTAGAGAGWSLSGCGSSATSCRACAPEAWRSSAASIARTGNRGFDVTRDMKASAGPDPNRRRCAAGCNRDRRRRQFFDTGRSLDQMSKRPDDVPTETRSRFTSTLPLKSRYAPPGLTIG